MGSIQYSHTLITHSSSTNFKQSYLRIRYNLTLKNQFKICTTSWLSTWNNNRCVPSFSIRTPNSILIMNLIVFNSRLVIKFVRDLYSYIHWTHDVPGMSSFKYSKLIVPRIQFGLHRFVRMWLAVVLLYICVIHVVCCCFQNRKSLIGWLDSRIPPRR